VQIKPKIGLNSYDINYNKPNKKASLKQKTEILTDFRLKITLNKNFLKILNIPV